MAWQLKGQIIESCSCNMFCPCWFADKEQMVMDQGWCAGVIAARISQGRSDGVDLSNRIVVNALDFPGPTLFDGNATARVYVDDGATPEQVQKLTAIFQGDVGGPMGLLAPLVTTWQPAQTARMLLNEDDGAIILAVGDAGTVESRLLRDAEGHSFTLRGGGFVAGLGFDDGVELAPSNSRWKEPGFRTFQAKSGARGAFTWTG